MNGYAPLRRAAIRRALLPALCLSALALLLAMPAPPAHAQDGSEVVEIPDPNLEAAIRDNINKPTGAITQADMERLWKLHAEGVRDLTGMEYAIRVGYLTLPGCAATSLAPLKDLPLFMLSISVQSNDLSILPPLPQWQELWVGGDALTSCDGCPVFPKLEVLHLGRTIENLEGLRGKLPRLNEIHFTQTQVSDLGPLSGAPELTLIEAPLNRIDSLSTLMNVPTLQRLLVSQNEIVSLSGFPHMPALRELDVSANQLVALQWLPAQVDKVKLPPAGKEADSISGADILPMLQTLDVSVNRLQSLEGVRDLPRLRLLDASDNAITRLSGLSNLPMLEILNLVSNRLRSLQTLGSFPSLQHLGVGGNPLEQLGGFGPVPQLRYLSASFCEITSVTGLPSMQRLEFLNLSQNKVGYVQPLAPVAPQLRWAHFDHNQLTSLAFLANLQLLEELHLDRNQIISTKGLLNLPSLEILEITNNPLQSLEDLEACQALVELDCFDCSITDIGPLATMDTLCHVNLSRNNISDVSALIACSDAGSFGDDLCGVSIDENPLSTDALCVQIPALRERGVNVHVTTSCGGDLDGDGIDDGTESEWGLKAWEEDTDGDGLNDSFETAYDGDAAAYNPHPAGGDCDANRKDTDGDGAEDGVEIAAGTDPLSAESDWTSMPVVSDWAPAAGAGVEETEQTLWLGNQTFRLGFPKRPAGYRDGVLDIRETNGEWRRFAL